MTLRIYKYELVISNSVQTIKVPRGSVITSIAMQDGKLFMWLEHETEEVISERQYAIYATGQDITCPEHFMFCETVHTPPYVWHVYSNIPSRFM
jgi:hypothetical protein